MEESLYEIESMRRFVGVDLEHIPDETSILRFRHRLEENNLTQTLDLFQNSLRVGDLQENRSAEPDRETKYSTFTSF